MSGSEDGLTLTNSDGELTGASSLDGVLKYLNSGGNPSEVILSGILGIVVSVTTGVSDIFIAIAQFPAQLISSVTRSATALFEGFIASPASIITGGDGFVGAAATTGIEISNTFTGFLGVFAFPAGVASILLGLWLITTYLEEGTTSDFVPGTFTDIDVPDPLSSVLPDPGVAEEGEDQDARD